LRLSSTFANRRKNAVSEIPITISGITSETKIRVEYSDRPRNLKRVSAKAARVPMTVAIRVAVIATFKVLRNAWSAASLCMSPLYQRVVKPPQLVPLLALLKLNTTSITIGANKNANTNAA